MDWDSNSISDQSFEASQESPLGEEEERQAVHMQGEEKGESTPDPPIQLSEEDITCQICCKYALHPSNCLNQKCKKLFCGSCVASTKSSVQSKCPFCRLAPFQVQASPYARQINHMQLVCQLCKEKYVLEREEKHFKQSCTFFHLIQCRYCEQKLSKDNVIAHTKEQHPERIEQIILDSYNNAPHHDYRTLLTKHKLYFEKIDKRPHLGTSGKFYCGGKLQTKCSCCNGHCGPTNGENCVECMKLDIQRYGLAKGFLVNSAGMICFKSGEDFICGSRLYYQQGQCSEHNTCRACANMKKNIRRYQCLI